MKKVTNCIVENCIPTPSSCTIWNGGDIEVLGIKNGDMLNNVIVEIVGKLEDLAGDDLSKFDIDTLIAICNETAPLEVNLINILTLMRNNQICLKEYINGLNERLNELSQASGVNVNLRCYANFDNLGTALSINRDQLDQLVIDNLCSQRGKIISLEGAITNINSKIDNLDLRRTVEEKKIATCINAAVIPTSDQLIVTSKKLCDVVKINGDVDKITSALSRTPDLTAFAGLPGWIAAPADWADNYSNLLLAFGALVGRVVSIETNCCAPSCDDVKIGFSAFMNEDGDGVILKFSSGAGTIIPTGWVDKGSTGVIKDVDGNVETFNITIKNGLEDEIFVDNLNRTADLMVTITYKIGNGNILCEKTISKAIKTEGCGYCEITAAGQPGATAVIIYEEGTGDRVVNVPAIEEPS